jgi:hypothetical protein
MEFPSLNGTIIKSKLKCLPVRWRHETSEGMVPCGINCEFRIDVARDDASIVDPDYDGPRRGLGYTVTVNDVDVTRGVWDSVASFAYVLRSPKPKFGQIRESIPRSEQFKNHIDVLKSFKETVDEILQEPKQNLDNVLSRAQSTIKKVRFQKTSDDHIRQLSKSVLHAPQSDRTPNHGISSPFRLKRQASMLFRTTMSNSNNLNTFITSKVPRSSTPEIVYYPIVTYDMSEEQMAGIYRWIINAHEGEEDPLDRSLFKVITSAQLLRMKGADMDTIERLHRYHGPPSTPVPEGEPEVCAIASEASEEQHDGEQPYLEELEEENERQPKHKDLVKYLGLESDSLHIMKEPTCSYIDPANLSDYYRVPIINTDDDLLEELEDLKIPSWEGPEADADHNPRDYDRPARTDFMPAPRAHKPSHNIVLYLWNRGYSNFEIASMIQPLDPNFLYNFSGWVWKGLFIPEYFEMTDEKIGKLKELAPAPIREWEMLGEMDGHGEEFTTTYKNLRNRQQTRNLMIFVEKIIGNHFSYRIRRGYIAYPEITIQHSATGKGWRRSLGP